jgi:uncharacterized protein YhaN
MRILKVTLDGMGCFNGNRGPFEFGNDRVVILGPNEAGKSTLMQSISALLFGFEKSAEEERWRPWGKCKRFGGRIEFSANGQDYVLDREWGIDKVILTHNGDILYDDDVNPRGKKETDEAFRNVLADILPISGEGIFRMLSFVRQEELAESIEEDLRERITGSGRQDALEVRERIRKRFEDLTWEKPPWGMRKLTKKRQIEELQEVLDDRKRRRDDARVKLNQAMQTEHRLNEVEGEIKKVADDLQPDKQALERIEVYADLLAREGDAKKKLTDVAAELQRVEKLHTKKEEISNKINQQYSDYARAPENAGELIMHYKDRLDSKAEIEERIEIEQSKVVVGKNISWKTIVPIPIGLIAVGMIGLAFGELLVGVLIGAGIGLAGALLWRYISTRTAAIQHNIVLETVGRLKDSLEKVTTELEEFRSQLSPLLNHGDPDEPLKQWRDYQSLATDLHATESAIASIRSLEDMRAAHEVARADYIGCSDKVQQLVKGNSYLAQFQEHPENLAAETERRRAANQALERQIEKLTQERDRLDREWVRATGGMVDDVENLEQEIQQFEKQLVNLTRQKNALILAVECMTDAIESIRDEHRGTIQGRLDGLFRSWTQRKDRSVLLDDQWNPIIRDPLKNAVMPNLLSQGTHDQLYLAYRVALSEALSKEIALPFLLDDPFVHFDPERRKSAREAFEAISERHQVILFTQDPSFGDWGEIVRL